jgi:hypothetical protein
MPQVTNKPSATTHQVGSTVYIPYSNASPSPTIAVVEKTESVVLDVNEDGTGEQTDIYYFVGMGNFNLPASLVFVDGATLETYIDNLIDDLA